LLGNVVDAAVHLNQYGTIVEQIWHQIPHHFPSISIDAAVVMPNHFHGIIIISNEPSFPNQDLNKPPKTDLKQPTLGQVVAYFKYQSTMLINTVRDMVGVKLWQRNYYEHIIRTDASLTRLRTYIEQNPQKWQIDQLHPENPSKW